MEQKNILCFGDSNTHGYNSKTGGRFTVEERWTKLLQRKLGDDYYVIEEGLSGRTTSFDDPVFEGLSGLNAIYPCMMTHEPLDLVIIMLGTNDTKDRFNANGFIIGKGLERLTQKAIDTHAAWRNKPNILLVARRQSIRIMQKRLLQERWVTNAWSVPEHLPKNLRMLQTG